MEPDNLPQMTSPGKYAAIDVAGMEPIHRVTQVEYNKREHMKIAPGRRGYAYIWGRFSTESRPQVASIVVLFNAEARRQLKQKMKRKNLSGWLQIIPMEACGSSRA
jgi:hypothetical protein